MVIIPFWEKRLTQWVNLDPQSSALLAPIRDRVIRLHFQKAWDVRWDGAQFKLGEATSDVAALHVWCTPSLLVQWVKTRSSEIPTGIRVEGDIALLRACEQIVQRWQPDWALECARWLGDPLTLLLERGVRRGARRVQHLKKALPRQAGLYVSEEQRWIPSRGEYEAHTHQVRRLHQHLETLERRVGALIEEFR